MEKSIFPRTLRERGEISNLLPKLKRDAVDDLLGVLKISSVVDGTDVRGNGIVGNHSYRWKMAIESAVKSIAVVPDKFFDINGRAYPIDQNRKVSAHSLPTYENFKDAVIYRINNKTKHCPPPVAKIIYDLAIQDSTKNNKHEILNYKITNAKYSRATLAELLKNSVENTYTVYQNGIVAKKDNGKNQYVPYTPLTTVIDGTKTVAEDGGSVTYSYEGKIYAEPLTTKIPEEQLVEYNEDILNNTLITYLQNHAATDLIKNDKDNTEPLHDEFGSIEKVERYLNTALADYLAIVVDNNNEYHALVGKLEKEPESQTTFVQYEDAFAKSTVLWYQPEVPINVKQFEGIDMWLRFDSINEMIYFLITKYEDNILSIVPATVTSYDSDGVETTDTSNVDSGSTNVQKNEDKESKQLEGKLWAYVNPRTMTPYSDDYWFHQGEPFYKKSLTIAPKGKKIKGKKIVVKAGQFPGMYMLVGETYIRSREDGQDERMQIKFPLCKITSEQTLTLEADGEPTVFNLNAEIASPPNGIMMELNTYEVADRLLEGEDGCFYAVDGSTEVLSE